MKKYGYHLPRSVARMVRLEAAKAECSMSDIVREALVEWAQKRGVM